MDGWMICMFFFLRNVRLCFCWVVIVLWFSWVVLVVVLSRVWCFFVGRLVSRLLLVIRNWLEYWMLVRVRYFCIW